jgi:hypothetical protein
MYLQFREEFNLPVAQVYPYFATPADWAKLYGEVKPTKNLGNRGVEYARFVGCNWSFYPGVGPVHTISSKQNGFCYQVVPAAKALSMTI